MQWGINILVIRQSWNALSLDQLHFADISLLVTERIGALRLLSTVCEKYQSHPRCDQKKEVSMFTDNVLFIFVDRDLSGKPTTGITSEARSNKTKMEHSIMESFY